MPLKQDKLINGIKEESCHTSRTEKTIAITIANMVNSLLNILLSMAAARFLRKEDVALSSQTFLAYNTFAPILLLGIPQGIYYFLSQNDDKKRTVIKECIVCVSFSSMIFSLFIVWGGNRVLSSAFDNVGLRYTLYWLIPYIFLNAISSILVCVFVYENKLRLNALLSVIQTFSVLIVSLTVVIIVRTGECLVISRIVVSCLFSIIIIVLVFCLLPRDRSGISLKSIKALVTISAPLGVSAMFGAFSSNLDRWIISVMLDADTYAVYTQGARELPLVGTITASISTVIIVDLTKAAKNGNYQSAIELFRLVASKSSLFLMPVMVFFVITANQMIEILYTRSYIDAADIFRIYLLYLPIRIVYYDPLLIALGKSRFMMWKTMASLVINAILSYVFVVAFGAKGAAFATILSVYVFAVPLNLYVISKVTKIRWTYLLPFKDVVINVLYAIPGGIVCLVFSILIKNKINILLIFLIEAILFVMVTLAIYEKQKRVDIKQLIYRIRHKLNL